MSLIEGLTNAGTLPVLERAMQFAARRHGIVSNNVANMTTPGFRQVDVSRESFQAQLRSAIDRRREQSGAHGGSLILGDTRDVSVHEDGMTLHPETTDRNILFQDGNDRDVERTMQDLVENFLAFRTAAQFMRGEYDILHTAIRERM